MKKLIIFFTIGIIICLSNVYVKASDVTPSPTEEPSPTPTPEINNFVKFELKSGGSYSINAMMDYYHYVLVGEQKKIAKFLLGSYNYMYMTSRGMSYQNVNTFEAYIQKFFDVADIVFGVDYVESNTSRWNENFRIFISSIISYAGSINVDFETWLSDIAPNLIIPYSEKWLDAWTTYYNDPSNEGIAEFGSETREWQLGNQYEYMFGDYPFADQEYANNYLNFILNHSPLMYSDVYNGVTQILISFKDVPLVDTIYVLRAAQGHGLRYYRFGYYNGTFSNSNMYFEGYEKVNNPNSSWNNKVYRFTYGTGSYNLNVNDNGSEVPIDDLINAAIYKTPFTSNISSYYHNWYYGITHVVLVDDLYTLTNRQDVNNDFSLGIITDYRWIKKPKNNGLPYWWKPIDFEVEIESPSGDLDPAEEDDFDQSIVNNTVINNYDIIAPGVTINVPTDWFNNLSDDTDNYVLDTLEYTLPFFSLVGDIFDVLGDIRVAIMGILVLGLVAGVTSKFLL